jgi:hypothetical protein
VEAKSSNDVYGSNFTYQIPSTETPEVTISKPEAPKKENKKSKKDYKF